MVDENAADQTADLMASHIIDTGAAVNELLFRNRAEDNQSARTPRPHL